MPIPLPPPLSPPEKEEDVSVSGQKAYNKTISTEDLTAGEHTYEVVYSYGEDQTASSLGVFTVNAGILFR